MNWYYSEGGAQKGPVDDATFSALVSAGTILPSTLVWHDGMADWKPLSVAAPELAPQVVPPPTPAGAAPGTPVPNHLVGAILSTIFCCLPFGIAAIVFASQVNTKLAAGDTAGAQEASQKAHKWMVAAIIVGLIVNLINLAIQVVAVMGAMAEA